jgi:uncharacterized membrane protein YhaH (DUF805 family)
MDWMVLPLSRCATFTGRSRRKEYWLYGAMLIVGAFLAIFLDLMFMFSDIVVVRRGDTTSIHYVPHQALFLLTLVLATLVPTLAVNVRRLHDIGRSGWWLLIALVPLVGWVVLLVFACLDGTVGANRFGPDPKAAERRAAAAAIMADTSEEPLHT